MLKNVKPVKPKFDATEIAPERRELEDQIVEMAMSGKLDEAAAQAIRKQVALGLPITFMRGDKVIKQFPDGREELLATIETPPYTLPAGVKIIGKQ